VIVGIGTDEELRAAWEQLHQNVKTAQPDVELDGVLVEQMAAKGLELIVGAKRDPDWGPVLLVGLGGVWTEALDAVEILPADVTLEEVLQQISQMKGHKLLGAFRGQPARDVEALADVVVKIGEAMRADPAIREIDINPVIVFAEGEGAVALDALIIREPD
jgi:acetate---CoA ligase (ADP-forming)